MAITILTPVADDVGTLQDEDSIDSDDDVHMSGGTGARPPKRSQGRKRTADSIVVPGQLVTDDPQWMRYVILVIPQASFLLLEFRPNYL